MLSRSDRAFLHLGGFTLVAVCTAAVILAAADGRWAGTQVLQLAPLWAVGRLSYGLYPWHMPVFDVVNRYGAGWGAPARVVTAAVTVGSWKLLERPFLTLKDRFGPASTRHPVHVPVTAGKV